tara:strand:- start:563 stop:2419 length:1857 start_codon:yes stop_codon:yes gene_type:complete
MSWTDDGYGEYVWIDDDNTGWFDGTDPLSTFWGNEEDGNFDLGTGSVFNPDGTLNTALSATFSTAPTDLIGQLAAIAGKVGTSGMNALKGLFTTNGEPDWAKIAAVGLATYNVMSNQDKGGYNTPIPKIDMVRQQVQYNDPNRRPGEAGLQYFTDPRFAETGDPEALTAANTAANTQAAGLQAAYQPSAAPTANPWAGKLLPQTNSQAVQQPTLLPALPASAVSTMLPVPMAAGGIAKAKQGRYLDGQTDGMADKIPSSIDGKQPAALSHGEFVVPADVVSHLGNGNSNAGAEKLYEMMARIREARTGNPHQGKQINPDSVLNAAMGGLASAYVGGGVVTTSTTDTAGFGGVPLDRSVSSSLSPWAGDYVTNALGQGAAAANAPYQAYTGPLTAGASNLQQQAFAGASDIAQSTYQPSQITGGLFDANAAAQYMNPYLQTSLNPQLAELQRQNTIANMTNSGKLVNAGAYGGSRQAVMTAENQRNMLDKTNSLVSQGYNTAYDKAMSQFNSDQSRQMDAQKANEASRQYSQDFGLQAIDKLATLGETERNITSQGIAADKAQFEEQRDWAYKMPQYQLGLLSGVPYGASTTSTNQDAASLLNSSAAGGLSLYKLLSGQ